MNNIFQGRSLLAEKDFTKEELMYLIDFSLHLKEMKKKGIPHHYLEGKNMSWVTEPLLAAKESVFSWTCY